MIISLFCSVVLEYLFIFIYLYFLELDDFDEIEDRLVTTKKSKKCLNGSGSSVKRTMADNLEPISKKISSTDSSNSIQNESCLKPSDDSRDGIIVFFIAYVFKTTLF